MVTGWTRHGAWQASLAPSRLLLCLLCAGLGLSLTGCGTDRPARVNDTATAAPSAEPEPGAAAPPAVSMNGWRLDDAGQLLVVPAAATALSAQLVFPQFTDSTLTPAAPFDLGVAQGMEVELFSTAGLVGRATLSEPVPGVPAHAPRAGEGSCTAWPQARVVPSVEPLMPWTVAFAAGRAQPIQLDSISGLSPTDSSRLAVEVARIASTLPQDTASAFRGLPFVVRNARRFSPLPGIQAIAATVTRRVNQEASQRMEQIFLVAERAEDRPRSGYRIAYTERVEGEEETMELSDILAAVRLGPSGRPTLVIGRDYGDGNSYSIIERAADGRWSVRWNSAYAGC